MLTTHELLNRLISRFDARCTPTADVSLDELDSLFNEISEKCDDLIELRDPLATHYERERARLADSMSNHPDYPNDAYLADDSL